MTWSGYTKYKKEFCKEIVESAKKNISITKFCVDNNFTLRVCEQWQHKYPDFKEACDLAKDILLTFHEKKAEDIVNGDLDAKGQNMLQFIMKNNYRKYRERKEQEIKVTTVQAQDVVSSEIWEDDD